MHHNSTSFLKFQEYGPALSGRSLPKRILSKLHLKKDEKVFLDFEGIEAINLAFINELLNGLINSHFNFELINSTDKISKLFSVELKRLSDIRNATEVKTEEKN